MDGGIIMKQRWAELSEYLQCGTKGWLTTGVKLVGRRIQKAGSGPGIIKAEPSLLWSFFFSLCFFLSARTPPPPPPRFFDQCQICPNWHLYYGRSRPGRSEGLGECERCVKGGGWGLHTQCLIVQAQVLPGDN